jgi:hypothetical protein
MPVPLDIDKVALAAGQPAAELAECHQVDLVVDPYRHVVAAIEIDHSRIPHDRRSADHR